MTNTEAGRRVGITGTRYGCTPAQHAALASLLAGLRPSVLLHGCCKGVDIEAAALADALPERPRIVSLPGPDGVWRADDPYSDETLPEETHFARNRDIVAGCDVLVVVPKESERQPRGGTWYTHDHAVKVGRPAIIVWPDGRVFQAAALEGRR